MVKPDPGAVNFGTVQATVSSVTLNLAAGRRILGVLVHPWSSTPCVVP
jgi:hypothetical protein